MTSVLVELEHLLDEENRAARAADLDRLADVQTRKRELFDRLAGEGASGDAVSRIRNKAEANLRLMRTLVQLFRGMARVDDTTVYRRTGLSPGEGIGSSRGRL